MGKDERARVEAPCWVVISVGGVVEYSGGEFPQSAARWCTMFVVQNRLAATAVAVDAPRCS